LNQLLGRCTGSKTWAETLMDTLGEGEANENAQGNTYRNADGNIAEHDA
jgi:hypothetical protein